MSVPPSSCARAELKILNWNPIMACKDVDVSWDYDGTPLLPDETAKIKIKLENVGRDYHSQPRHPHNREARLKTPAHEKKDLRRALFYFSSEATHLTDALRRMAKPPLEDRKVFVHRSE